MNVLQTMGMAVIWVVGLALGVVILGKSLSSIAEAKWLKNPKGPGRVMDVRGYRRYATLRGEKGPVVLIEPGLGVPSPEWWDIQAEIARHARILTYDRAGLGWSDSVPAPRTGRRIAEELHDLLKAEGLSAPYILVGHSQGGLYLRHFGVLYPQEVAGAVFIDPLSPEDNRFAHELPGKVYRKSGVNKLPNLKRAQALGCLGLLRLLKPLLQKSPSFHSQGLSAEVREIIWQDYMLPKAWGTAMDEYVQAHEPAHNQGVVPQETYPEVPIKVLYHDPEVIVREMIKYGRLTVQEAWQVEHLWQELVREYLTLSKRAEWQVVDNSGHNIHLERPEVVVGAVLAMIKNLQV
ncbi:MAG TPA: alpha/beta hydrolase, partial [Verrucomicrobiae bacterium]|nr:alpha/beta hydrolase [Verrucomicrobiae bacterium]